MKYILPTPMEKLTHNMAIDTESFWSNEPDMAISSITKCVKCPYRQFCRGELQFCRKLCPNYQGFVS